MRAVYGLLDELLAASGEDPVWRRLRQRGPAPVLADAEIRTIETGPANWSSVITSSGSGSALRGT